MDVSMEWGERVYSPIVTGLLKNLCIMRCVKVIEIAFVKLHKDLMNKICIFFGSAIDFSALL